MIHEMNATLKSKSKTRRILMMTIEDQLIFDQCDHSLKQIISI